MINISEFITFLLFYDVILIITVEWSLLTDVYTLSFFREKFLTAWGSGFVGGIHHVMQVWFPRIICSCGIGSHRLPSPFTVTNIIQFAACSEGINGKMILCIMVMITFELAYIYPNRGM